MKEDWTMEIGYAYPTSPISKKNGGKGGYYVFCKGELTFYQDKIDAVNYASEKLDQGNLLDPKFVSQIAYLNMTCDISPKEALSLYAKMRLS